MVIYILSKRYHKINIKSDNNKYWNTSAFEALDAIK
jgi:hypothetical protein